MAAYETDWKRPQTVAQSTEPWQVGSCSWLNPNNLKVADGVASVGGSPIAGYPLSADLLRLTNFGFAVPRRATITYIEFKATMYAEWNIEEQGGTYSIVVDRSAVTFGDLHPGTFFLLKPGDDSPFFSNPADPVTGDGRRDVYRTAADGYNDGQYNLGPQYSWKMLFSPTQVTVHYGRTNYYSGGSLRAVDPFWTDTTWAAANLAHAGVNVAGFGVAFSPEIWNTHAERNPLIAYIKNPMMKIYYDWDGLAGYQHNVNGVTGESIASINGVDVEEIDSFRGV